jgi:hypothetical protein
MEVEVADKDGQGGRGRGNPQTSADQPHLTQVTKEIEEETNEEHAVFNAKTDNDQALAAPSASQSSATPGWTLETHEDSSVARQPRDHSQAPTAADTYKICQGDSPFNPRIFMPLETKNTNQRSKLSFHDWNNKSVTTHATKGVRDSASLGKATPSVILSFSSSHVQTQHSHHIDVMQLQTTLSRSDAKETLVSQ